MKASDYIVSYFESLGISVIFGYQGGMITHLVDSISKSSKIRFIQTYHEQSAAIAAEGYARESGKIGVAISTSGPGATNMVTGIANAFFELYSRCLYHRSGKYLRIQVQQKNQTTGFSGNRYNQYCQTDNQICGFNR